MSASRRSAVAVVGVAAGVGALLALPATADSALAAAALTGSCAATVHVDTQWTGGEIVTVTVANTAASAATKWVATWTPATGQRIVSAWNAIVTTTGGTVSAANVSYNGALAPGASTTFGMQLSGPASTPAPSCANDAAGTSTGADVTVTTADNFRTVTLFVGQTLAVSLPPQYLPPTAGSPALSRVSVSGGYPTGQPLAALYRAVAPGPVDITTHTDYACLHDPRPCAAPIALWTVHVVVTT